MPNEPKCKISGQLAAAALLLLQSCAVTLPPGPATSAADPRAPEAANAPLHPSLLASARTYLSPTADDRAEKQEEKMDMSTMDHSMHSMSPAPEEKR